MFRICFLSHHHTATPIPSHLHHYHHHLYLPIIFLSNTISPCLPRQQHHNLSSAQSSLFGPSSPLVSTTPMSYSILLINTLSLFLPDLMGFGNEAWSQWRPFPPGFFSLLSFYGCWYLWKFELPHPRTWRIHCRTDPHCSYFSPVSHPSSTLLTDDLSKTQFWKWNLSFRGSPEPSDKVQIPWKTLDTVSCSQFPPHLLPLP